MTKTAEIIALVTANPHQLRAVEVARQFNVSRQLVDQLPGPIKELLKPRQWTAFCPECGKKISYHGSLCRPCRMKKTPRVERTCPTCGKSQVIRISLIRGALTYCSKTCLGKAIGKKYGFGVHPENIGGHKRTAVLGAASEKVK